MDESEQSVVHAQVVPGFLVDSGERTVAQDHPRPALVGFELVKDRLDLPALDVERGELAGWGRPGGVEQSGQQPVGGVLGARPAWVVQRVLDDPDGADALAAALVGGGDQLANSSAPSEAHANPSVRLRISSLIPAAANSVIASTW